MIKWFLTLLLSTACFAQAPVLTFQKLRNVNPPSVQLSWTAVSTPTPDYDIYQAKGSGATCPALTSSAWTEILDGSTNTTLTVSIPVSGDQDVIYCWYVDGYPNGVSTPSNTVLAWIETGGYVFFNYFTPDPNTGGCPVVAATSAMQPYPYSSGGSVVITQSLNSVNTNMDVIGPVFYKSAAGAVTGEGFAFHINVFDTATYTATATFPDGSVYTFPLFTNWAQTSPGADFYDSWTLDKLLGSSTICRRTLYQDEQPTD
jgi:hypothetical protein